MAAPQETPRAEATRARLLAAAVSAFAERGYHATTTRDIAAAAGMSPAALYVHHASKEELLYEIARRGHEEVLAALASCSAEGDPAGQLRAPGVDITRWYHPGGFTAGEIAAAYADMALRIVGAR
jgi:AcrR family transcriptional regulator